MRTKPRRSFLHSAPPLIPGGSIKQEPALCQQSTGKHLPPWQAAEISGDHRATPASHRALIGFARASATLSFSLRQKSAAEIRPINHVLNKSCFEDRLGRKLSFKAPSYFLFLLRHIYSYPGVPKQKCTHTCISHNRCLLRVWVYCAAQELIC